MCSCCIKSFQGKDRNLDLLLRVPGMDDYAIDIQESHYWKLLCSVISSLRSIAVEPSVCQKQATITIIIYTYTADMERRV